MHATERTSPRGTALNTILAYAPYRREENRFGIAVADMAGERRRFGGVGAWWPAFLEDLWASTTRKASSARHERGATHVQLHPLGAGIEGQVGTVEVLREAARQLQPNSAFRSAVRERLRLIGGISQTAEVRLSLVTDVHGFVLLAEADGAPTAFPKRGDPVATVFFRDRQLVHHVGILARHGDRHEVVERLVFARFTDSPAEGAWEPARLFVLPLGANGRVDGYLAFLYGTPRPRPPPFVEPTVAPSERPANGKGGGPAESVGSTTTAARAQARSHHAMDED